uniref:NADH-ubiquinone oxidoreductase chain 3 n=1 Tax=Taenia pisiformis TaxID=85432 RepID=D3YLT1_TAEPI|nr:NADH dehydrogenase subunit 3 [Taenia pisiformis]ADC52496.1 NADH dehydrogenase subunit 3 [Taenia pisiformis]QQY84930.1 NADH dehydrogenase subunit 3 [Taenia pisiformis]
MAVLIFGVSLFVFLFLIIGFFSSSVLNKLLAANNNWGSAYECGFFSSLINLNCFSFTYFSLLVVFVIFDLEISLLLNMPTQGLLYESFFFYYFFLLILFISYIIEVFTGYVRWLY